MCNALLRVCLDIPLLKETQKSFYSNCNRVRKITSLIVYFAMLGIECFGLISEATRLRFLTESNFSHEAAPEAERFTRNQRFGPMAASRNSGGIVGVTSEIGRKYSIPSTDVNYRENRDTFLSFIPLFLSHLYLIFILFISHLYLFLCISIFSTFYPTDRNNRNQYIRISKTSFLFLGASRSVYLPRTK